MVLTRLCLRKLKKKCIAVHETGVCRHHRDPIEDTPRTSRHYCMKGFDWSPFKPILTLYTHNSRPIRVQTMNDFGKHWSPLLAHSIQKSHLQGKCMHTLALAHVPFLELNLKKINQNK